ncbi:MAG: MBL fold metallo-hydrolase [Acidobacteriota bacterium]
MSVQRASCAIVLTLSALHPTLVVGQAATPSSTTGAARKAEATRLLANVLHLRDNDVRFKTSKGKVVFVDPMAGPADPAAVKRGMTKPDLILITHSHLDHCNVVVLKGYADRNPNLVLVGPADVVAYAKVNGIPVAEVKPDQEYTMAGFRFRTVAAYVLDGSHPREKNWVGYVLSIDGASYYVTGDTQPLAEMAQAKPDVLFPPVFGCGSNVEQALQMVAACTPGVTVPVHTGGEQGVIEAFLTRLPREVQGAHFEDGTLVVRPRAAAKQAPSAGRGDAMLPLRSVGRSSAATGRVPSRAGA